MLRQGPHSSCAWQRVFLRLLFCVCCCPQTYMLCDLEQRDEALPHHAVKVGRRWNKGKEELARICLEEGQKGSRRHGVGHRDGGRASKVAASGDCGFKRGRGKWRLRVQAGPWQVATAGSRPR